MVSKSASKQSLAKRRLSLSKSTMNSVSMGGGTSTVTNDDENEKRQRALERVQKVTNSSSREGRSFLHTNGEITEHYADCIRLCAENKINAKNAFGLYLIDYFESFIKGNSDYQVMSSALDVSVKIYAGRVDAVYSESHKVLMGIHSKKAPETAEPEEEEVPEKKAKKKRRKRTMVEANPKNITDQTDSFANSVVIKSLVKTAEADNVTDIIYKTLISSGSIEMVFDRDDELVESPVVAGSARIGEVLMGGDSIIGESLGLFDFDGWELAEEILEGRRTQHTDSSLRSVYEDMACAGDETLRVDVEDTIVPDQPTPRDEFAKFDKILKIMTTKVSEYSYFDKNLFAKLNNPQPVPRTPRKLNSAAEPKRRVLRVNRPLDLRPTEIETEDVSDPVVLSSWPTAVIKGLETENYTMSKTVGVKLSKCLEMDINGLSFIARKYSDKADFLTRFRSRNENLCDLSVFGGNGDSVDNHTSDIMPPTPLNSVPVTENPNKVALLDMSFTRSSRKVNIEKIKSAILERVGGGGVCLSEVYEPVLGDLPKSTSDNMSWSMMFVSALHLAGEGAIRIEPVDGMKDVLLERL